MIVFVNRLQVPEGMGDRLEQGFRHASGMKDVPGCLGFELWRSAGGREYEAVTRWRTREDFEAWRRSDAFRHAHRNTRGMEEIESSLIEYEVLIGG
jgi:heme-degrading monooxygenase HmoA